jgi:hypothetical protein
MIEEETEFKLPDIKLKPKRRSSFFGFESTPVPVSNEKDEEEAYLKKLENEGK